MNREYTSRNGPCPCGSGKKYKRCCSYKAQAQTDTGQRPVVHRVSTEQSLLTETLAFIDEACELAGVAIHADGQSGTARGPQDARTVRTVYERLLHHLPHTSDYRAILEDIRTSDFVGVYLGSPNLSSIANHLTRFSLYTQKILVTNPFCDGLVHSEGVSPLDAPEKWVQVVVQQAVYLAALRPWIAAGIVVCVPPLPWYERDFFRGEIVPRSRDRVSRMPATLRRQLATDATIHFLKSLHPDDVPLALESILGRAMSAEQARELQEALGDPDYNPPINYAFSRPAEGRSTILKYGSGQTLEMALATAAGVGGYLLMGEELHFQAYEHALADGGSPASPELTDLSLAMSQCRFSFLNGVPLDFALSLRTENRLAGLRAFLVKLWREVDSGTSLSHRQNVVMYRDALEEEYQKYKREWEDIDRNLASLGITTGVGSALATLVGTLSWQGGMAISATAWVGELISSWHRRRVARRAPLAVFFDLERRQARGR